ncbi:MAG TPA: hypothetical protein VEC35_06505 [Noviherbaspirillum sp.]|nr:hypothetical protein [Noviherbaspirillum sp.]
MDAQEGQVPNEEVVFAKLMKKLRGEQVTMPENDGRKVIRPDGREMSIVEVTEELMRQLKRNSA